MSKQIRQDQYQFINQEIETLPEHEKNILKMRFWECYTIEEIASFHKLSQTLIKSLIDEAVHKLRLSYLIEFSKPKDREVQCNKLAS